MIFVILVLEIEIARLLSIGPLEMFLSLHRPLCDQLHSSPALSIIFQPALFVSFSFAGCASKPTKEKFVNSWQFTKRKYHSFYQTVRLTQSNEIP